MRKHILLGLGKSRHVHKHLMHYTLNKHNYKDHHSLIKPFENLSLGQSVNNKIKTIEPLKCKM